MKEREDGPATGLQQLARERKLPRAAPSKANETKTRTRKEEKRNGEGRRRAQGGLCRLAAEASV